MAPLRRSVGIWLLSAGAAAAAAALLIATTDFTGPERTLAIPWWALVIGFFMAEFAVVHIHIRRETHTVSLSEVPLVLGLFALSPVALVAVLVAGMGAGLVLYRRQRPVKVVFNLAQSALGAALAVAIFRSTVAGHDPFGPFGWVAGFAAASVASATGIALVAAAVSLVGERPTVERLATTATISLFGAITAASLALAAAVMAETHPSSAVLLVFPAAACVLALGAYGLQRRRHDYLQSLYDSMVRRGESPELDTAVHQLLLAARRLLRAEYAEILFMPRDPHESPLRSSIGTQHEQLLKPSEISPAERVALETLIAGQRPVAMAKDRRSAALDPYLTERGLKDGVVTALESESGLLGLLLVGDRTDDVSTFGQEDEKLLRTFAGHARLLLENEQLEQSLAKLTDLEAKLRHQALHDALTGLPNRRLFHARVEEALEGAKAEGNHPVVLFLDLDGFKAINDELGHAAGDELLVAFGERLRGNVRPHELPARLGGDEFAVLLESGGPKVAEDVAERLIAAVKDPFSIDGRRLSVRLSIGIAAAGDAAGVEGLLANADLAMYAAKSEGLSGYHVYSEHMRGSAEGRRKLSKALEEALERDQISVHYQPIVDLRTGATVAYEALARWRRDRSDTVPAADFLPIAQDRALIECIGQVVLRTACVQTQEWRSDTARLGELSVCVNLSATEFGNTRLSANIASALLESGLDAGRLILEITEDVASADPEATLATMTELRRLGVRFSLDEFGSGRSSLAELCRLPFDVVKIARPLVDRLGGAASDERVTRAIVGLATSLGLKVVAEGIETRDQAERLKELGCHLGQGFYFDPALPVPQATRRLRTPSSSPLRLVTAETA